MKKLITAFVFVSSLVVVIFSYLASTNKSENEIYTVTLSQKGQTIGTITNAVIITNCTPHCKAIVYKEGTNLFTFHAWMIDVSVKTNKILEKK
jgi:hypothetical protein